MMIKRYHPNKDFPPYRFLPGKEVHPNLPGGHMYEEGEPAPHKLDITAPWESESFCYCLDLFNHGFYWEGHVYLEALWNGHGRKGAIADLFKALIKLCAAGVKFELGQWGASNGHLERALELLQQVQNEEGETVLGLSLNDLMIAVEDQMKRSDRFTLQLKPNWD